MSLRRVSLMNRITPIISSFDLDVRDEWVAMVSCMLDVDTDVRSRFLCSPIEVAGEFGLVRLEGPCSSLLGCCCFCCAVRKL